MKGHLAEFPKNSSNLTFEDEVLDTLIFNGVDIRTSRFVRLGLKEANFSNSSLTQCLFEDCYLRKVSFTDVHFTGSRFRNCNLEKATFSSCDLRYVTFNKTTLNRSEIIGCLPKEFNLRRDIARNLRKNFESLGDKESADIFLDIEIEANEMYLLEAFKQTTDYYRRHYNFMGQIEAGFKYLCSKASGFVWGYGHRILRLLRSYFVIIVLFALLRLSTGTYTVDAAKNANIFDVMLQSFATSLGTSSTTFYNISHWERLINLSEGLIGTLFLALLAAAVYRRIAR